ncbi:kp4 domain-containing protein [Hirsutella rhossiliensis]|uniref:Kp4 domain-containing protein n=1 Tax=Hirsutella rhossiliensis TaxID=111463 RepID=A0A9P8MRM3_9HYPO|nr:kp4 domain-containing protein [Hirsutella rhossiliensis]KAH0960010.1 kp4 domain-containing protein [Hirsutella rhossiliensis]
MVSLAALATLIASAAALGINCRGSDACPLNDAKLSEILVQVKQLQAQGKGTHHYKPGVQLACAQGKHASMCASYQRGAGGSADRAVELIQGLIDHKCQQCGSIPTQPGNDVSKGELTVNIVSAPCCKGNCHCPV